MPALSLFVLGENEDVIAALLATALLGRPVWSVVGDRLFGAMPKKGPITGAGILRAADKIGMQTLAPPFRLGGSTSWIVGLFDRGHPGMTFLISREGADPVYAINDDGLLPQSGFVDGERIVLAGTYGWIGNGPNPAACVIQGAKVLQLVSADFESEVCHFNERVARIHGRTYPSVINVCHAMANVEVVSQFTYRKGRLVVGPSKRTMNPMAVLDDLAGAASRRDYHAVRRLTTNDKLAMDVVELGVGLKEAGWGVPGSVCSVTNTVFDAQPLSYSNAAAVCSH